MPHSISPEPSSTPDIDLPDVPSSPPAASGSGQPGAEPTSEDYQGQQNSQELPDDPAQNRLDDLFDDEEDEFTSSGAINGTPQAPL